MEILKEKIEKWLEVGSGYGSDDGSGSGYGSGYGDGSGYGYGYGSGDGSGDGSGSGYGSGYGYGYGSGSGYGSGYGSGDGYCFGSGYGLKVINNKYIWLIDGAPTIINLINRNVAKGFMLQKDLSLKPCYVAKGHNKFAHGETIKEALQDLQEKIFEDMDTEKAIGEFKNKFKKDKKYKGITFYKWHHILTGSCKMGRDSFVENHQLNLNKLYTVKEFIELTENDYGGEIVRQLKEYYI